jgi:hypothetical protein
MLHQEHVRVEVGNPLLALLRDSKVAQGIQNIGLHHLPEKMWVIRPQIGRTLVSQFLAGSGLAKLIK